jgi:hypothetical protein
MKKSYLVLSMFLTSLFLIGISGCNDDNNDPDEPAGKVVLHFMHYCDGAPMVFDSTGYTNEAGNLYEVNEIQYFISDVILHKSDGKQIMIKKENDIYYVDTDIPATQKWQVFDPIPAGTYTGISFTFGINEQKNNSFMYVNPPEVNMVWPEFLGGGYHYLKLNGKYDDPPYLRPFNFHLGIGQIYPPNSQNTDSILGFVQNNFEVILPNSGFTIAKNQTVDIEVIMQVEEWFRNPNIWDHEVWGNYTMQNQDAMQAMKENGHNVFKVGKIE